MDLKLSNNLFLGLQELIHFKNSIKGSGYEKILSQMISKYGVVRPFNSPSFDKLRVIDSGLGQISIKAGVAIDNQLRVIELTQDLIDEITVPNDNVQRYVIIKYNTTVVEKGTVNVQADGSLIGTGTEFESRLRGLPNFASKIVFTNSQNNTQEYTVQAVQSDTVASLNVAAEQITAESNLKYSVVGTFTPGINVPTEDKYPFVGDSYIVELRTSDSVIEGQEFVLATVTNNNDVLSIEDKRISNIFNYSSNALDALNSITTVLDVISCTQIKFTPTIGAKDKSEVKVEWGIRSNSWDLDTNTRQLRLFSGQGGKWSNLSDFESGDFVGQYVVFENGQACKILSSTLVNNEVTLEIEYQPSYLETGSIVIAPQGLIHLRYTDQSKNYVYDQYVASFTGYALMNLMPGEYLVQYRIIDDESISIFRNIEDSSYYNEASFNDNGFLNTGSTTSVNYTNGLITVTKSTSSLYDVLDNIVFPGVVWDYFGSVDDIPVGWKLCDGSLINYPSSQFHNTNAPDLGGKVVVGFKQNSQKFGTLKQEGGEEEVSLTTPQLPAHAHSATIGGGNHQHDYRDIYFSEISGTVPTPTNVGSNDSDADNRGLDMTRTTDMGGSHSHDITINNTGDGEAHNNLQPYLVGYKIMKL